MAAMPRPTAAAQRKRLRAWGGRRWLVICRWRPLRDAVRAHRHEAGHEADEERLDEVSPRIGVQRARRPQHRQGWAEKLPILPTPDVRATRTLAIVNGGKGLGAGPLVGPGHVPPIPSKLPQI